MWGFGWDLESKGGWEGHGTWSSTPREPGSCCGHGLGTVLQLWGPLVIPSM